MFILWPLNPSETGTWEAIGQLKKVVQAINRRQDTPLAEIDGIL